MKTLPIIIYALLSLVLFSCDPGAGPCTPNVVTQQCEETKMAGMWTPYADHTNLTWMYWYADSVEITADSFYTYLNGITKIGYAWRWDSLGYPSSHYPHLIETHNSFWPNDSLWRPQRIEILTDSFMRWSVSSPHTRNPITVTFER